jgi:glycosyltransferase involved in cell wall biosynthesis
MQLLEDERLLAEMGQRARAIALDEYSLELQASRYLEVYRRMLSK